MISLWLALLTASAARADDWLAVLPECAGERVPSVAQLLYPRDGLPALVPAGETLIVRVRLPLPLTPPPGVQQPRALEGFAATLVGHARSLDGRPLEQRVQLEVVDVRPEGPSSLRYRLALPVPAWTAPGTYDLSLEAKGASLRAASSVRVLSQGGVPRVARLLEHLQFWHAGALLSPLDAFIDERDASGRDASLPDASDWHASLARPTGSGPVMRQLVAAAPPMLRTAGLNAALRVGDALWVIGGCEAPYLPFDVEVESVLRAERRKRVARIDVPVAPARLTSPAAPGFEADFLTPVGDGWELRAAGAPFELSLLISAAPGSPGLRADRGTLRFYPAGDVAHAPGALVARWSTPSSPARLLRVPAAPLHASLQLQPDPVRGDALLRVGVRANRALAAVALRLDHRHSAYGLAPVEHRYRALGKQRIAAVAIAEDGTAVALQRDATVVPAPMSRGPSCAITGPSAAGRPVSAGQGLWLGALLLKRRRRRVPGNRLGAEPRSA